MGRMKEWGMANAEELAQERREALPWSREALDYPPPPVKWSHPTAAEELARVRQEVTNAEGRAGLMAQQARNAADLQDGPQAVYWRRKAQEAHAQAAFWRDVLANITGTQVQPEEEGDAGAYQEEYERSKNGGA